MGEAIITARIGDSVVRTKWRYKTELIIQNTIWEVPVNADVSKGISVRIFGGGGKGSEYTGGGGGYMNNAILSLNHGDKVLINIGIGGGYSSSLTGGTTTFGSYLSANGATSYSNVPDLRGNVYVGGSGGSGGGCQDNGAMPWGSNGSRGGKGHQFGGGGGIYGGDGGYWGGGGGSFYGLMPFASFGITQNHTYAGNGGYYGGGGGLVCMNNYIDGKSNDNKIPEDSVGGYGGYYGGGGGGVWYVPSDIDNFSEQDIKFTRGGCIRYNNYESESAIIGYSGFGGAGTTAIGIDQYVKMNKIYNAKNGTDTSTWTNVFNDGNGYFRGKGLAGNNGGGGGGFGGNGGHGYIKNKRGGSGDRNYIEYNYMYIIGGGGGGYGGNGGNAGYLNFRMVHPNNSRITDSYFGGASGGGGGFGGDGGNGALYNDHSLGTYILTCFGVGGGGGGGGYGKSAKGGDACGGGGGYYGRGGNNCGGGGSYGNGGDGAIRTKHEGSIGHTTDGEYGGGGGSGGGYGGNGICIIQYYAKELIY